MDPLFADGGRSSSGSGTLRLKDLPITMDGVNEIFCTQCGKGCFSRNPYVGNIPSELRPDDASDSETEPADLEQYDDVFHGYRPWGRYKRHPQLPFRIPCSGQCLPCNVTFVEAGLSLQYGTVSVYQKSVSGDPQSHQGFRRALREEIRIGREDVRVPAAERKRRLRGVVVETVSSKEATGNRKISRKTFVHEQQIRERY